MALLFAISALDPFTCVGAAALLNAIAVMASGVPAWHAVRVDPATALRAE